MIKNTHYHLNKFIKGASGCNCPGDGVFFIRISLGIPTLTNISGSLTTFPTSPFLKRFIKSLGVTLDGIYGFRVYDGDVMFDDILTCPNTFVASEEVKEFVFNTNNCEDLDDGFYGILVDGCDASYTKVFNYDDCGIDAPTGITSNSYTCGDVILSWNDVTGAISYTITQGANTYTSTISMVTIPYTSNGTKVFSVVANGIAGSSTITTIDVDMVQCSIIGLTDNNYVHGDLTLSWEANPSATYYSITYGVTTTTSVTPTIVIPITTGGPVTYQVSSCDLSGCSVATSITVTMMQSNVTGISTIGYICGDLNLQWDPVVGATGYTITGGGFSGSVVGTTISVPFLSSGATVYTVFASNPNGLNAGGSISVTMSSCGITGLSTSGYTCGDLTLDWSDVPGATSYTVSYGVTTTTVISSTIIIPYSVLGPVEYTVRSFAGTTQLSSATITVDMISCVVPNVYALSSSMQIISSDNVTSPLTNTTAIDTIGSGEITGYVGVMNPLRIEQNPYTKSLHYMTTSGLYVGQVGIKTVTLVSSLTTLSKPAYTNNGFTRYLDYATGRFYKGSDNGLGTVITEIYISADPYFDIDCNANGSVLMGIRKYGISMLYTSGGVRTGVAGSSNWSSTYTGNKSIRCDKISGYFYFLSDREGLGYYFYRTGTNSTSSIRINNNGRGGNTVCAPFSEIEHFSVYNQEIFFTTKAIGLEGGWSSSSSGGYAIMNMQNHAGILRSDSSIISLNSTTVNNTTLDTSGSSRFQLTRVVNRSTECAQDGFAYICGIGSLFHSNGSISFSGAVIMKVNLNGGYLSAVTPVIHGYPSNLCSGSNLRKGQVFRK